MTYRIPKSLAFHTAHDNQLRRALAVYLVLKNTVDGGRWNFRDDAMNATLARACGYKSVKSLHTHIYRLAQEQLIQFSIDGNKLECVGEQMFFVKKDHVGKPITATLASWKTLQEKYGCSSRFYIREVPRGIKLHHVLLALFIHEQKLRCKIQFTKKLKRDHDHRRAFRNATAQSLKNDDVLHSQVDCFVREGADYGDDERFALTDFQHRADFNCSYARFSQLLGYWTVVRTVNGEPQTICGGGFAYTKRKLSSLGLIRVTPSVTVLPGHTTAVSRKTMLGSVHYAPQQRRPVLTMPDRIEVAM